MKIDYVISYVDSTKEKWQNEFSKYAKFNHQSKLENKRRFVTNIFFKYVFRGINRYMPWINNIFLLVSDYDQVPSWINDNNVKVVTHDQFIPHEFLPTFNSCTIECFLHQIPGLSNLFIYGNDDMYVFNDCLESMFFENMMPLCTLVKHPISIYNNKLSQYSRMMKQMTQKVLNALHIDYDNSFFYSPMHVQNAFSKIIFERIFKSNMQIILKGITKFREDCNISQYFFTNYYMLSTQKKYELKNANNISKSLDLILQFDIVQSIIFNNSLKYKLICLNNNNENKDIILYHMFNKKFPEKSKYEK